MKFRLSICWCWIDSSAFIQFGEKRFSSFFREFDATGDRNIRCVVELFLNLPDSQILLWFHYFQVHRRSTCDKLWNLCWASIRRECHCHLWDQLRAVAISAGLVLEAATLVCFLPSCNIPFYQLPLTVCLPEKILASLVICSCFTFSLNLVFCLRELDVPSDVVGVFQFQLLLSLIVALISNYLWHVKFLETYIPNYLRTNVS